MARKRHSLDKAIIFIVLIATMNLLGISYGNWQDSLSGKIRTRTGYIQPNSEENLEVNKSEGLNKLEVELGEDSDNKTIQIYGEIENGIEGEFQLKYKVANNGSLPIEFDNDLFEDMIQQVDGLVVLERPSGKVIYPDDSISDSITLHIDAQEIDYSITDAPETESSQVVGEYDFEVVLPYRLSVD